MTGRTFAEPKKKNSTTFSPILGKKSGQTLNTKSANGGHDMINPGFGHDLSNSRVTSDQSFKQSCPLALSSPTYCPFGGACHTCPARVQTKLMVGQPGDKYEQEADRVAEQVMDRSESQPVQKMEVSGWHQTSYTNVQRSTTHQAALAAVPPVVKEVLRSPGQPLFSETRSFMEPQFGHHFDQLSVHGEVLETIQTKPPVSEMGNNLGTASGVLRNLAITGSPEEPTEMPPTKLTGPTSVQPHPFTAIFLMAKSSSSSCYVPKGNYGATKHAKYRIVDATGKPVRKRKTVKERFSKEDGPDEVFKRLKPNVYEATEGYFDDCYRLYSPEKPPYFRLKVEQNHMIDGEIISKNRITYTPSNILVCVFARKGKGFGTRCKLY